MSQDCKEKLGIEFYFKTKQARLFVFIVQWAEKFLSQVYSSMFRCQPDDFHFFFFSTDLQKFSISLGIHSFHQDLVFLCVCESAV